MRLSVPSKPGQLRTALLVSSLHNYTHICAYMRDSGWRGSRYEVADGLSDVHAARNTATAQQREVHRCSP